jgi:hypothetical protein
MASGGRGERSGKSGGTRASGARRRAGMRALDERARADAAAIVARIPASVAASAMTAELETGVAAFADLSPESHADIVRGVQRTLSRWTRFLSSGVMPPESDFEPVREWARARTAEGVRLEDLLRSFGLLHQVGWELLRRHARPEEQGALLELAGPLARYADQVSAIVAETYLAERELLVSEEERRTHTLLERLCEDAPLGPGDAELAERLEVPVHERYVPFAVVLPGRPPHRHAALAARLRRGGWRLTVTHSEAVNGLTWLPLELSDLGEGADVALVLGEPTPRRELAAARDELAVLVEHARRSGARGVLRLQDHLLEVIAGRSQRLVQRLREQLLGPLAAGERAELALTLRTLLACRLDRAAASARLHVHRNTLSYRLARIEQLCGVDLGDPHDIACAYLALREELDADAEA